MRPGASGNATGGEIERAWGWLKRLLEEKGGSLRALRPVRVAASGVDTTRTSSFCAPRFQDRANLRVRAIPNAMFVVDDDAKWGGILADGILAV